MNIKLELLKKGVSDMLTERFSDLEIDADAIVSTAAVNALSEIREVVENGKLSDFEAMEGIVSIFEKYGLNTGGRHDF